MENDDQLKKTELMQKNVVYYQVMLEAYIESRNEIDRQLLILSTAAIGLLLAFSDKVNTCLSKVLLLIAAVLFLVTILVILRIFHLNAEIIKHELKSNNDLVQRVSDRMDCLDKMVKVLFSIGVVSTITLIMSSIFTSNI